MTVNIHKETEFIGIQAIKIANLENVITAMEEDRKSIRMIISVRNKR